MKFELGERLGAALGDGIEAAERFHLIAEQIDARGCRITGRPDIENAAANREIALFHHGADAVIALGFQESRPICGVEHGAGGDVAGHAGELRGLHDALDRRIDGGEQHQRAGAARLQAGERRDALGDDGGVRRNPVIGQAIPGRKAAR